jgi:hypothetical protein
MSEDAVLARMLTEILARETALFDAYEAALHAARGRAAREVFMRGQLGCARSRGRLMAEMERLSVPAAGVRPEVPADPAGLRVAEEAQLAGYREVGRRAEAMGDARLGRLVALHIGEHEERRARLTGLGEDVSGS